MKLQVFKNHPLAQLPKAVYEGDAGFDVSIVDIHSHNQELGVTVFKTGLHVVIPPGYVLEMYARSSLWKSGWMLANNVGIIDAGYRGEVLVALCRIPGRLTAPEEFAFPARVCQLVPRKLETVLVVPGGEWEHHQAKYTNTQRSIGGFGSSGI